MEVIRVIFVKNIIADVSHFPKDRDRVDLLEDLETISKSKYESLLLIHRCAVFIIRSRRSDFRGADALEPGHPETGFHKARNSGFGSGWK